MDLNININQLKRNLNLEDDYDDDNVLLQHLLDTSSAAVQTFLGPTSLTGYTSETIPIEIQHATLLLATHFYLNRNIVSYGVGTPIPYSFQFLLLPYKEFVCD